MNTAKWRAIAFMFIFNIPCSSFAARTPPPAETSASDASLQELRLALNAFSAGSKAHAGRPGALAGIDVFGTSQITLSQIQATFGSQIEQFARAYLEGDSEEAASLQQGRRIAWKGLPPGPGRRQIELPTKAVLQDPRPLAIAESWISGYVFGGAWTGTRWSRT